MKVFIDSDTLQNYKSREKLHMFLNSNLGLTYFRVTKDCLSIYMKGPIGVFKVDLPASSNEDTECYFSLGYDKWTNALDKFIGYNGIYLSINKNLIKISVDGSPDVINLSISSHSNDDREISSLNSLLEKGKEEAENGYSLNINDDIAGDLSLVNSLFIPQQDVNSIGLGKKGVIYAVRSVILKTLFKDECDDGFFYGLQDDEDYVYLHKFLISFITKVYSSNPNFCFFDNYHKVYWEDDNSYACFTQPYIELDIPRDEDLDSFAPNTNNDGTFSVDVTTLKESLEFFDGFYVGSVWKPIKFEASSNKEVIMRYEHPTADIIKALPSTSPEDGSFALDSETIKKVVAKVKDKRDNKESPLQASFYFDNILPGVLCTIGDSYKIIFSKLEDED